MAVALVFAMKLRDRNIHLDDDLEEFMSSVQPAITADNYSEILRRAERSNSEITDSLQSNEDDDDEDEENDEDDDAVLATLSDETENEDEDEDENELESTIRGKGRQVCKFSSFDRNHLSLPGRGRKFGEIAMAKVDCIWHVKKKMV